jgi:hypothetical protein
MMAKLEIGDESLTAAIGQILGKFLGTVMASYSTATQQFRELPAGDSG